MYYLPKMLAEKFAYFGKFSIFGIWAISFVSVILFTFIASHDVWMMTCVAGEALPPLPYWTARP